MFQLGGSVSGRWAASTPSSWYLGRLLVSRMIIHVPYLFLKVGPSTPSLGAPRLFTSGRGLLGGPLRLASPDNSACLTAVAASLYLAASSVSRRCEKRIVRCGPSTWCTTPSSLWSTGRVCCGRRLTTGGLSRPSVRRPTSSAQSLRFLPAGCTTPSSLLSSQPFIPSFLQSAPLSLRPSVRPFVHQSVAPLICPGFRYAHSLFLPHLLLSK